MDLNIHAPLPRRKDFRIGVLGSGFIVNDCHLAAYRKAGFNPVAIASRNANHAADVAQRHQIQKVYQSYDELLDDPSLEVLDIAVPPNAQLALIKAACARKTAKGILAQKPLGMSYAEGLEAVAVCEAAGITLAVNQNMRYDHSVRAAKTLLENGTIGEPVFATIEMRAIPHWMDWHKDLGWLTLRIMSIHHLDTFRYWFGDPESIYCSLRADPRTKFPHTDGICTYILEYKSGLRCIGIDDTWAGPGKEGCPSDNYLRWRIEGLNGLAIGDIGWCKDPYTTPSTIRYASKGQNEFQCPTWTESWFPDAFIGTMSQLLIALENGKDSEISGRDNLKTMGLVEAAYLSAEQFRSVAVDEITPITEMTFGAEDTGFFRRFLFGDGASIFERMSLTPRAQQVLSLAQEEANSLSHHFVGSEHLLLGLIKLPGQGVANSILLHAGFDLQRARTEIIEQVGEGPGPRSPGPVPFSPRVKNVVRVAAKEAKNLNHTYIGTEHLLLALLADREGVASRILSACSVDVKKMRREILTEIDPTSRR